MNHEKPTSDVAFSPAVKRIQSERHSRAAYASNDFAREITDALVGFLGDIDTAFLATASADGQPYVQHRGGPPGFVRALDAHTIGFVELAGNRQYVSHGNLSENDRVCLMLIDYATKRRVKVWGRARVVPYDAAMMRALPHVGAGKPERAVLITVTAWDANCPAHIPQKVDAADVAEVIGKLRARIAELERAR